MTASRAQLYRYHTENARAVEAGLRQIRRRTNEAIKTGDNAALVPLTRTYALLLAAVSECRLKQLSYEPPLTSRDTSRMRPSGATQAEQWHAAIDLGFRKRYPKLRGDLSKKLPFTARQRRDALRSIVQDDLAPVITMRNSLAHGQWKYVLTNDETDVNTTLMQLLSNDNIAVLAQKRNVLNALYEAVSHLLLSSSAFDRDFDRLYSKVETAKVRLRNLDWTKHVEVLRAKHQAGQIMRGLMMD